MGAGGVGQGVVKSLEVISDDEFLGREGVAGILPFVATRTITSDKQVMRAADAGRFAHRRNSEKKSVHPDHRE